MLISAKQIQNLLFFIVCIANTPENSILTSKTKDRLKELYQGILDQQPDELKEIK